MGLDGRSENRRFFKKFVGTNSQQNGGSRIVFKSSNENEANSRGKIGKWGKFLDTLVTLK